jgi:hypothetical protein
VSSRHASHRGAAHRRRTHQLPPPRHGRGLHRFLMKVMMNSATHPRRQSRSSCPHPQRCGPTPSVGCPLPPLRRRATSPSSFGLPTTVLNSLHLPFPAPPPSAPFTHSIPIGPHSGLTRTRRIGNAPVTLFAHPGSVPSEHCRYGPNVFSPTILSPAIAASLVGFDPIADRPS